MLHPQPFAATPSEGTSKIARRPTPATLRIPMGALDASRGHDLGLSEVMVRGIAVAPLRTYVETAFGPREWPRYTAVLGQDGRALLAQPILAMNWYPFGVVTKLVDGLVDFANGRVSVLRDFAIHNLDFATSAIFRAIFKIGSPEFMVARSDQVWKKYYSHGRMVCDVMRGHARIELHEFPWLTPHYHRLLVHSMEAVLLKAGARLTRMAQPRSVLTGDAFSEFVYEWI